MNLNEAISSIIQTTDQIVETAGALSEEMIRWKPAEDVWSVMEILCHVEEVTPYWLNEIRQILKNPAEEWGRGLQNEARLQAVARADERDLKDVLNGIEQSKSLVREILGSLTQDDLKIEATSRNPRFGTKPVSFVVQHLMVEHLAKHLQQMKRNIEAYQS